MYTTILDFGKVKSWEYEGRKKMMDYFCILERTIIPLILLDT